MKFRSPESRQRLQITLLELSQTHFFIPRTCQKQPQIHVKKNIQIEIVHYNYICKSFFFSKNWKIFRNVKNLKFYNTRTIKLPQLSQDNVHFHRKDKHPPKRKISVGYRFRLDYNAWLYANRAIFARRVLSDEPGKSLAISAPIGYLL